MGEGFRKCGHFRHFGVKALIARRLPMTNECQEGVRAVIRVLTGDSAQDGYKVWVGPRSWRFGPSGGSPDASANPAELVLWPADAHAQHIPRRARQVRPLPVHEGDAHADCREGGDCWDGAGGAVRRRRRIFGELIQPSIFVRTVFMAED